MFKTLLLGSVLFAILEIGIGKRISKTMEEMSHHKYTHHYTSSLGKMAASATLHCLIGCAIGEIVGVTIGTSFSLASYVTIILAFVLSFVSGYTVSTWPLVKVKVPFKQALKLVFVADTASILTMTIVDNIIMFTVPGAMDKNLTNPTYWLSRAISLSAAFVVAYPLNLYLLKRGKGHALMHKYHH